MESIKGLFSFLEFLHKFQNIYRNAPVIGRKQMETDAEHSFQLAMVAWYLIDKYNLDLNIELVLKYALAHDLVEVYAGDTDPHNSTKAYKDSKGEREKAALAKIKLDWNEFESLAKSIEEYESFSNKESNYVYLLDKISPVINTYLAKHPYYKNSAVTYDKWDSWLAGKENNLTEELPDSIKKFVQELRSFLKVNSKELFSEISSFKNT